ncbi:MAG: hypothetical protein JKY17_09205 [Magnetovibrio sp.]|nr:hypothetical protein [Magnetovibrio sp.]
MSFKVDNIEGKELTVDIIDSCRIVYSAVLVNKDFNFIMFEITKDDLKESMIPKKIASLSFNAVKITNWRITEDNCLMIGVY